jgi:hypothetical protein
VKRKPIEQSKWKWFGHAGHFICAQWCRFHLCTQVGKYLVSTVGEYFPDAPVREIMARQRNIVLEGRGDERVADYARKIGFETMGASPHCYGTMVFEAGSPCSLKDCGCGLPSIDGRDLDSSRWMTAKEATEGHYAFCKKFAAKEAPCP